MPSQRKCHSGCVTPSRRLLVSVEGNIAAGKSSFIEKLTGMLSPTDLRVVSEPVEQWRQVEGQNLLDLYYRDPSRYAYAFQTLALSSRHRAVSSVTGQAPLLVAERSPRSYRLFTETLHELDLLSDVEWGCYNQVYSDVMQQLDSMPDVLIYLRSTPEECLRRLKQRARPEEADIDLSYLQRLHDKHEQWLLPPEGCSTNCMVVDASVNFCEDTATAKAFLERTVSRLGELLQPRLKLVRTNSHSAKLAAFQIQPVSPRLREIKWPSNDDVVDCGPWVTPV